MIEHSKARRDFLKAAATLTAATAVTLWLPRMAKGGPPAGSVKRVIILNAYGALRYNASFDGQTDKQSNPWGLMPWGLVGSGSAPEWGFSRMLCQRPLPMDATDWAGNIVPYLSSDDAAHYNLARPVLSTWNGMSLPTFADIASETAVVRNTANPGGAFDGDHGSARHTLYTGFRSGQVGLATAMQAALQTQMGSAFDAYYPLPAVTIKDATFGLGIGSYASARPIFLSSPTKLPTTDPGKSISAWGKKAELELDTAFEASRQSIMQQAIADFINDKSAGDAHVSQLVNPALQLATAPDSAALGTLIDGKTPLTNGMLTEAFGLTDAKAAPGDMFFDCFAALQNSSTPTWSMMENAYGLAGALAVRLLQVGSPIVTVALGNYDSHSYEVIDPQNKQPQTVQVVQIARLMAGLELVLKNTVDPQDPAHSLWDSTVVFVCSEFGRASEPGDVGSNGFNSANGSNDGGSGHGHWAAWPVLGGPVASGGKLLVDSANDGFFHQNRIFTTILKGMGVDEQNSSYLPYGTFAPIPGLLKGV